MRDRRRLRWIVPLVVVSLVAAVAGWLVWPSGAERRAAPRPDGVLISYAGAGTRLAGMDDVEAAEQLRDWARFGLATHLGLDTTELVDGFHDTFPVRDDGFADLARQPVGPGRSLFADGVLHLLVPHGEPHEDRVVAPLLDQHRTDSGADPATVRLHHYTVDTGNRTILVESGKPVPTKDFRAAHGYVRTRVDTEEGLSDFLAATRALSTVEVDGDAVVASGWRLSDEVGEPLSREDVAVLQRAYRPDAGGPAPGFSLDPGPVESEDDLAAILPALSEELRNGVLHDVWSGPHFGSADDAIKKIKKALLSESPGTSTPGLPADRTQLRALLTTVSGGSPYSQARYDGELRGTEVGMTLFYTDYVTKDWVSGVGNGVPADAVAGFVPDPLARTPWAHCEQTVGSGGEAGRLWFGQNDTAFSYTDDRISIGAQPTRLFARSDGAAGDEVESSYSFGRGLRWWDRHYAAVAAYEPQYQRLDQIMRWSAALEWLGSDGARLPSYADVDIRDDLRFADWYRDHGGLRENAPIPFVSPPSATEEAVLTVPSEAYEDCGFVEVRGGVSLANLAARTAQKHRGFDADLPGPMRRAGLYDTASAFDRTTGTGSVKQVSIGDRGAVSGYLAHTISRAADGAATVAVTAGPRAVIPLGSLKVWHDPAAPRSAGTELAAGKGTASQQVGYQGHDLGGLSAVKHGDVVTLRWRSGLVDRMRNAAESVQNRLSADRGDTPVDGVLYSVRDARGRDLYRVGEGSEPWLRIESDSGAGLSFRLGAPGRPHSFTVLEPPPALPAGSAMKVTPATADSAAVAVVAERPAGLRSVQVTTMDGRSSVLGRERDGDSVWVGTNDPVLGLHGTVEGAALLRDYPRVAAAMRAAAEADDGLLRHVDLGGEGVVLVGADRVWLVGPQHPWAHTVSRVAGKNASPVFAVVGEHLVSQARVPLHPVPGSRQERVLGDVLDGDALVLIHDSLRATAPDGPVFSDALPRALEVVTVDATAPGGAVVDGAAAAADSWRYDGHTWWRVVDGPGGGSGDQVVLVCPGDDDDENGACAA